MSVKAGELAAALQNIGINNSVYVRNGDTYYEVESVSVVAGDATTSNVVIGAGGEVEAP
jgi:hypothetical protein